MECQVNIKSQSELDIGGRETCYSSPPSSCEVKSVELYLHEKDCMIKGANGLI